MESGNLFFTDVNNIMEQPVAREILKSGEYGFLSLQAEAGGGYGIPVNYVWDRGNSIYIHCSPSGRKLNCINQCNKVSFCVVGKTSLDLSHFNFQYESVVMNCEAHISLHQAERMSALSMLVSKYAPNNKIEGMELAEKAFGRIEIIRLDILQTAVKSTL